MATTTRQPEQPQPETAEIQIFSTCPQSKDVPSEQYLENIIDVARWSEAAGCKGILVYTDNSIVDPWLVAQVILQNTERLCPLIAVQPIYMHPYAVAKKISTYGYLYHRQVYLNLVAGGFKNDLTALNDLTPHDRRYDRLTEYTLIVKRLLESNGPVTFDGEFYKTENLRMTPPLSPDLVPGIFVSGSSDAGLDAARALDAVAIQYPHPVSEYEQTSLPAGLTCGIRIGIIARENAQEAWGIAHERFPSDRRGELLHQLAMKVSDSVWHRQLSSMGEHPIPDSPYWLEPFRHTKTNCPYLVGTYEQVAQEVARYVAVGYKTFILDIPPSQEELRHINLVFSLAAAQGAPTGAPPSAGRSELNAM